MQERGSVKPMNNSDICSSIVHPNDAYNECKDTLRETDINNAPLASYRFYKTNDGKYYINDKPIESLDVNLENCRIVKDIITVKVGSPNPEHTINPQPTVINALDDNQILTLCKRAHELDLVCSVYDRNKLIEHGRDNDIQINLYEYNNAITGKTEYHFLTPSELKIVNNNLYNGKSGLSIATEKNVCFRKLQIDNVCVS